MVGADEGGIARRRFSLDQLIALNDEIAALSRSGLPLERGLLELGRDVSGRLGAIATALGTRLSQGESLTDALAAEGRSIPPLYAAVVEAGVRAGRLPAALEGLAGYARRYAESRRLIGLALLYPLIVFSLAFVLFIFLVTEIIPRFHEAFVSLQLPVHPLTEFLVNAGATVRYWWPVLPVILVAVLFWWFRSGRSVSLRPRSGSAIAWVPWMGSILMNYEAANFAELLALLLEHQVPFPDAVILSAEASDDPALVKTCRTLADAVKGGASPAEALGEGSTLPPLLRWLIATGIHHGDLVGALRHMAALYHRRAQIQAEKVRLLLPTLMICAIGASAALVYALTLFIPFVTLLEELAV